MIGCVYRACYTSLMSNLILLTTPIGNLKDITSRALETLSQESFFAVEDTRTFRDLCNKLGVSLDAKKVTSLHDHSDPVKLDSLIEQVIQGENLVVVSEAGSPSISDPAYPLVKRAVERDIEILSAPGVSSVITALELSALPAIPFHFHGFLPREKGKKQKVFEEHGSVYGTHIYFEGVARVTETMKLICSIYPKASFAVARELTKQFESVYRFTGEEWSFIAENMTMKGEFVLLWHNDKESNTSNRASLELAQEILEKGAHPKKLSKLLAEISGLSPKECYEKLQSSRNY